MPVDVVQGDFGRKRKMQPGMQVTTYKVWARCEDDREGVPCTIVLELPSEGETQEELLDTMTQ